MDELTADATHMGKLEKLSKTFKLGARILFPVCSEAGSNEDFDDGVLLHTNSQ